MGWLVIIPKGPEVEVEQNSIILGRNAEYYPSERIAAVVVIAAHTSGRNPH